MKRSAPFETPRRCLGEYKVRQGNAISVKNEKMGEIKGKRIRRGLARQPGCLKNKVKDMGI
jgi:hypothetical protein